MSSANCIHKVNIPEMSSISHMEWQPRNSKIKYMMNLSITLNLTELSPAGAEGKVAQLKELIIKFSHMIFNSLYDITSNKYFEKAPIPLISFSLPDRQPSNIYCNMKLTYL